MTDQQENSRYAIAAKKFLEATAKEPPSSGSERRLVQPWWLDAAFDPEEEPSDCVRCHCSISLKDGREPQDDPELNVCDTCAQDLLAEMWSRHNAKRLASADKKLTNHEK